jgi:hypothetical protein
MKLLEVVEREKRRPIFDETKEKLILIAELFAQNLKALAPIYEEEIADLHKTIGDDMRAGRPAPMVPNFDGDELKLPSEIAERAIIASISAAQSPERQQLFPIRADDRGKLRAAFKYVQPQGSVEVLLRDWDDAP